MSEQRQEPTAKEEREQRFERRMTDAEALSRFQPTEIRAYREKLNNILGRERELVAATGQERLTPSDRVPL